MGEVCGPEDTYRLLVERFRDNWLYGLVAFALLEEERIEWMHHMETQEGAPPGHLQIRDWYRQLPGSVLPRVRGMAENVLNRYAETITTKIEADYRQQILEGAVVSEVREGNRFWPQFRRNLIAGIAGALIFSLLLVLVALVVFRDPSPVAMIKQSQEVSHER